MSEKDRTGLRDIEPIEYTRTPYVLIDIDRVVDAYRRLKNALPVNRIHYAVKCNPASGVLTAIADAGGSFEISSVAELRQLLNLGIDVDKAEVLFSHPVKRIADIKSAYRANVAGYAFDSAEEVEKLAAAAPGSRVFVRIAAPRHTSIVGSEGKFGVGTEEAISLLRRARDFGLDPYGVGFHVGSQMADCDAWPEAIARARHIGERANEYGIIIRMINIGGGFPAAYSDPVPDIETIGARIRTALNGLSGQIRVHAEPGRYLVAEAGLLVATVIGVAERHGRLRVLIDAGGLQGLIEALESARSLRYPVSDSKGSNQKLVGELAGPTNDSADGILDAVPMSADLRAGDRVYIGTAGAYCDIRAFSGFDQPAVYTRSTRGTAGQVQ